MSDSAEMSVAVQPANVATGARGRPSVLSISINSKSALHAANMPYLKQGGLFIPTNRHYALGDEIFLSLSLMDEPEKLPVAGRVVWITPAGAQGNKPQGIGVHFNDDESGKAARKKFEDILSGYVSSSRTTHTV